jgi:hypothetical protein
MVLFGCRAWGSRVGLVADSFGLTLTFLAAATLMAVGTASIGIWPLVDTFRMDRSPVARPGPPVALEPEADTGPVVGAHYLLDPGRARA